MTDDSKFYCTHCGKENFNIIRRNGRKREAGHLKNLWCWHEKEEHNCVEVKEGTHYDKACFDLEFNYGNFDENGKRKEDFKQFRLRLRKEGIIE